MNAGIEDRIARVINGLIPTTNLAGRFGDPEPLQERMAYYHTPGVSIALINDFTIEWARGFGVCEAGRPYEITPETLFQAGSISKPIFALAVMFLVQKGRLDLDEDVNNYLTSWKVPANSEWRPRVTLRQLLSHTAGTTVHGFPGYQITEPLPTVMQVLNGEPPANTARVQVNILPGLQSRYSGGGTTIAQQLLADIFARTSFPRIMSSLVLHPLGMTASTYEQPLFRGTAQTATAHPRKGVPLKGKFHVYPEMAAAGLWTTARDLAKAGVELLQILHGTKSDGLLSREIAEAMISPQLVDQRDGETEYAGLGFFCRGKGDGFYFGHGGVNEGFVALMRIYKSIGKGAVIMLNSNEGHPLLEEIMRAVAKEYEWPDVFPQTTAAEALYPADDYEGTFVGDGEMLFHTMVQDGKLWLRSSQQPFLPLLPASEADFFSEVVNTKVKLERLIDGKILMTINQEGKITRATKQN